MALRRRVPVMTLKDRCRSGVIWTPTSGRSRGNDGRFCRVHRHHPERTRRHCRWTPASGPAGSTPGVASSCRLRHSAGSHRRNRHGGSCRQSLRLDNQATGTGSAVEQRQTPVELAVADGVSRSQVGTDDAGTPLHRRTSHRPRRCPEHRRRQNRQTRSPGRLAC